MDAQGLGRPRLVPLRLFQGAFYQRLFQSLDVGFQALFQRHEIGPFSVEVRSHLQLNLVFCDDTASCQHERSRNNILKFPNIAGPGMVA